MARRSKRRLKRFPTYLLLYVLIAMWLAGCSDRLILFPSRDPIHAPGAHQIHVPFGKGTLDVWSKKSDGLSDAAPQGFVLHFGGNGDRAESGVERVADEWSDLPVEVWSMNYPGFGQSSGSARLSAIAPSALDTYDELNRRASGRPIFVSGHSIGTAAALYVAAHRPVAGVVLQNPPPLRQLIMGHYGWWNLWLAATPVAMHVPKSLDSIANGKAAKAPCVFIMAGRDDTVPPEYQYKVANAYAGPKHFVFLPDAGHNDLVAGQERFQLEEQLQWLCSSAHAGPTTRDVSAH